MNESIKKEPQTKKKSLQEIGIKNNTSEREAEINPQKKGGGNTQAGNS